MKLPYVIDNQTHVLADILKALLTEHTKSSASLRVGSMTVLMYLARCFAGADSNFFARFLGFIKAGPSFP